MISMWQLLKESVRGGYTFPVLFRLHNNTTQNVKGSCVEVLGFPLMFSSLFLMKRNNIYFFQI